MDRVATTDRTEDGRARSVDRFADASLQPNRGAKGASALGGAGPEPVLLGIAETPNEAPLAEAAVRLQQLWFAIPLSDRQRFGHCFSSMVLKALGLRPCSPQEVEA